MPVVVTEVGEQQQGSSQESRFPGCSARWRQQFFFGWNVYVNMWNVRYSVETDLYIFDSVCYFYLAGSLTLFGVCMGDRASKSVMGNSKPRLLKSSYTYTTPAREGELRNASAHDWGGREHMTKYNLNDWLRNKCSVTQTKTNITCEKNKKKRYRKGMVLQHLQAWFYLMLSIVLVCDYIATGFGHVTTVTTIGMFEDT